ncbi:MAG: restriction endonuclease subunit S [Acetobacter sp.]|nr:restriction endonuclease subunit S [Acetobacter sp.]
MSANNQTHIPVVWKTLAELGEIIGGRGLTKAELLKTGSIGCIHYGQIYTTYEISTTKTISFCTEETAEKCIKVFPGDIIFTKVGENKEDICKPVVWLGKKPIYTGAGAVVIRPKPECNPLYIAYYSQAQAFRLMVKHGATSTTVTNMSISSLKNINIPLPPPKNSRN